MRFARWIGMTVGLALILGGGGLAVRSAQEQRTSTEAAPSQAAPKDEFQRSWEIYNLRTAGKSGWQRGEEIYYFKCWMCHNKYTKGAPLLRDLYKRPKLASGQPVNDDTVADKIRNGGPGMPAYRHTLSHGDMADLLSYLREKCCFEADEPPRNPHYRY